MVTLYNDDCMNILKNIGDGQIDLIATDPPYRITSSGNPGNAGGMFVSKQSLDGKIFNHNDIDCEDYAPEFYRILKEGTHCYVMCNHINLIRFLNVFTDCGFKFVKSLIWDKQNKIMGKFYMSQFEYILLFRKGRERAINNCGTPDILSVPNKKEKDGEGNNLHDTEKPVELMKILIENSTNRGELVLDPFMGVGSTGIASKELGRDFIGIEIDNNYFDISNSRINGTSQTSELCQASLW